LADLAKEKRRLQNASQYKRMRELDLEGYNARYRKYAATYRKNSADKKSAKEKRFRAKAKDEKRFYCGTCGVTCTGAAQLARHNDSNRHKLAVRRGTGGKLRFHCEVCDAYFTHQCHLDRHKQGQRHKKRVAEAL
jgi:Zinc-finger of C2H2 type